MELLYHGGGGVANRLIGFYRFYPPINRFSDFGKIEPAYNRYGDSFFPSTIPISNNLPASAVNAVTSEAFKNQVTKIYDN